ncbi:MAG: aminotransferase class IV [Microthrixaceae bacterium]
MTSGADPVHDSDARPDASVVWLDGSLVEPTTARVRWDDHGLTVGDGVFETIKTVGAQPFALDAHLERLGHSADGLGFTPPPLPLVRDAVHAVARSWAVAAGADAVGRLRVTVTTGSGPAGSFRVPRDNADTSDPQLGCTLLVTASGLALSRQPTDVITVGWTRNERGALAGLKTTSYAENVLALAKAHEARASEALFANTRGQLCEGTGTNVFVESAGFLATPPLSSGCLAGVTRRLLIDALAGRGIEVDEVELPMEVLKVTSEAFLVSTGREVQPIANVDSVPLRSAPGPLTRAAIEAWDDTYS